MRIGKRARGREQEDWMSLASVRCLRMPLFQYALAWNLALVTSNMGSVLGADSSTQIPQDFPHFQVPGHESEMDTLRELHWRFYEHSGPAPTLWDEWMTLCTPWPAVQTDDRWMKMRERWRQAFANRRISSEGYVATHQHSSIAHQDGWPFPFWALGGGEGWGWHFSLAGIPGPQWCQTTTRPAEGWVAVGARPTGIADESWNLELTAPFATAQPPGPITIGVQQAPFIQLRWRARGLGDAQPFIEWQQEGQSEFPLNQRMYFDPIESDKIVYTMIPVFRHPRWKGKITALRLAFGNLAPGAKVGVQSLFTQYDTRHTVNNPNFVKGVAQEFWATRDLNVLREQISRVRLAMRWQMTALNGMKDKVIVAQFVGHDGISGLKREAEGKPATLQHGHGIGNHYWDILPGGYKDAYATMLYYDALRALAQIEQDIASHPQWNMPDDPMRFNPDELDRHADEVRASFRKTFWNPQTRRFVLGLDIDGKGYDYGYTFMNLEAIYYDLPTPQQSRDIMDWISGKRIVAGDTSTGPDIYHWRFAPRASTRRNLDWYGWFWSSPETFDFGYQVQDGGAVLGFSYHDLMSRLRLLGPDDAWARLREIIAWYHEVQSEGGPREYYKKPGRGTLQGGGNAGGLGIDAEFIESLLVPQVMLRGFAGFEPTADGFRLFPRLPEDWKSLTIDHVGLHDLTLQLHLTGNSIEIRKEGPLRHLYLLEIPPGPWSLDFLSHGGRPLRHRIVSIREKQIPLDWDVEAGVRLIRLEKGDPGYEAGVEGVAESVRTAAVSSNSRDTQEARKISEFQGPYRFLSNFWPATVEFEGISYPTVEHAYQSAKTLDRAERRRIAAMATPGEAKSAGRSFPLRPDWETIKFVVMEQCVRYKFTHHPELREQLLATGDAILEEGNAWGDRIWGVYQGVGENHLGKLLMQLRSELRGQGKTDATTSAPPE